jgi:hypothetical protein
MKIIHDGVGGDVDDTDVGHDIGDDVMNVIYDIKLNITHPLENNANAQFNKQFVNFSNTNFNKQNNL